MTAHLHGADVLSVADGLRCRRSLARAVTETTSPTIYGPVLLLVVASSVRERWLTAVGWALVAGVFVGVLPFVFLRWGSVRGRWSDHHVPDQAHRSVPLVFATLSVTGGLALLVIGAAPRPLVATVAGMLVGTASMLTFNRIGKLSIHSGVAAGAAVVLYAAFGLIGLAVGGAVFLAAAWSRVVLADHTLGEVLVGSLVGGVVAAAVVLPLY